MNMTLDRPSINTSLQVDNTCWWLLKCIPMCYLDEAASQAYRHLLCLPRMHNQWLMSLITKLGKSVHEDQSDCWGYSFRFLLT